MSQYFNSISVKFIVCTAIVTSISVLTAGLFPFYYFNQSINKEITQYNTQRLYYIRNTVDNRVFRQSLGVMSNLLTKKELNDTLYNCLQKSNAVDYSAVDSVMKTLKNKVNTNADVVSSVSVYYTGSRIILSSGEGIRYENDNSLKLPYDDGWIQLFQQHRKGKGLLWLPARRVPIYDNANESGCVVSLVSSFPSQNRSDVLFCLNIDERNIRRVINEITDVSDMNTMIVDDSGTVVSASDSNKIGTKVNVQIEKMLKNKDMTKDVMGMGDDETAISLIKSEYANWYYVLSVPSGFYFEKASLAKKFVILICTIIFLVLLACVILFSVKITSPFRRIMSRLKNRLQTREKPLQKNELLYIENALDVLYEKSDLQEQTLNENRELVMQTFFLNLLSGKNFDDKKIKSILDFLGLQWNRRYFTAGIIQNGFSLASRREMCELSGTVRNYVESNRMKDMDVIPLAYDDRHIALIFSVEKKNQAEAVAFINRFSMFAEETCATVLSCSVGSLCGRIQDIGQSYREACSAILYSALYVQTCAFEYSVTSAWDQNNSFCFKLVDELVRSMNEYKIDRCKQYLNIIMNSMIDEHVSYKVYSQVIGRIETAIDNLCLNTRIDLSELFSTSVMEQIESQRYITDVFQRVETVLTEIIRYILQQHSSSNAIYAGKAKQFIDENYNRDISIQDIADKLHISRNYLCRLFKETSSTTLLNYITEERMKKAKELLREGDFSVNEVAQQVGFNNATYFIKKFKQSFGITPYQFKNTP